MRRYLISLMICALSTLSMSCQSEKNEDVYSGKKKIAYASYQKVTLQHITPTPTQPTVIQKEQAASTTAQMITQGRPPVTVEVKEGESLNKSLKGKQSPNPAHQQVGQADQAPQEKTSTPQEKTSTPQEKTSTPQEKTSTPQEKNQLAAGWPKGQKGQPKAKAKPAGQGTSQPTPSKATRPASQPSSQPSLSSVIYGQIMIKGDLAQKIKPNSVLFVIVRRYAKGQRGMMLAATKVAKITAQSFPLKFAVTQKDAMMGSPLVGKVTVSARIDQDGDAISKQPGDIIGAAEKAVMVGVNPVTFELNNSL